MKKIVFSLFVLFISFMTICSVVTINAGDSKYYYKQLNSISKLYYEELERMYKDNLFIKNKEVDLIDANVVTKYDIENYRQGSNFIYNYFELAKEAFFLDYEELFYIDQDKVNIRIYLNKRNEYVCSLGSGLYSDVFKEGITYENVKKEISTFNEEVVAFTKGLKAETDIDEIISKIKSHGPIDNPYKVKGCLDSLGIDNILIEKHLKDENTFFQKLTNAYKKNGNYYLIEDNKKINEITPLDYMVSNGYSDLNNINQDNVTLLENKKDSSGITVLSKLLESKSIDETIFQRDTYEILFYSNNILLNVLESDSHTVLIPYPTGYGYNNQNIEYIVIKADSNEVIKSVSTPLGIVCELDASGKICIDAVNKLEESNYKGYVTLYSVGGKVTNEKVSLLKEGENTDIYIEADDNYYINKIYLDGKTIEFGNKKEIELSLNSDEIINGSLLLVEFIEKAKYDENNKPIEMKSQELKVSVVGANYAKIGQPIILSAEYNCFGDVTFEWYKDGKAIRGSNSSILLIYEMTESDRGIYTVKVTSSNGYYVNSGVSQEFKLYDYVETKQNALPVIGIFGIVAVLLVTAVILMDSALHKEKRDDE